MKCAVNVAEDIQEEGERYGKHVDKIEQYLLEFAKLSEDVAFRKEAMDKVQEVAGSEVQEDTVSDKSSVNRPFTDQCIYTLLK